MMQKTNNVPVLLLLIICAVLLWGVWVVGGRISSEDTLTMFDVGQGDATLLTTSDGHTVLIDGGPGRGVLRELSIVLPPWKRVLDGIIVTHPDADHLAGILAVLDVYDVSWVGITGIVDDAVLYRDFLEEMELRSSSLVILRQGHQITVGEDVVLTVLSPDDIIGLEFPDINATSIVLLISSGDGKHQALLMGDAERDIEYALLRDGLVPDVSLLKIGHHGSRFATSDAFLAATQPEIALISAGANNRYGHPAPSVLERLAKVGTRVLNTAKQGTIQLSLE